MTTLSAILGPVGAGKTKFINNLSKELQVPVFIPRYATLFRTQKPNPLCCYNGEKIDKPIVLDTVDELYSVSRAYPTVILDEFLFWAARGNQFLSTPNEEFHFYKTLLQSFENQNLIIATFDTDPFGQDFTIIPFIKRLANEVIMLTTKCYYCDGVAKYTYKASNIAGSPVGDLDAKFVAVCSVCLVKRSSFTSFAG